MKKATRILALVLCAVMCLGLFVGCGNKGKQNSDTPLVVGYSPFNSKFSPFFSETAYDQDVWTMTAIGLLNSDRQGSIIMKGIEGETKAYNGTDYTYYGPADCEIVENTDGTVDGKWDVFQGQVFQEFTNDPAHYQDRRFTHVIAPFDIPREWRVYRSYDFGYAKPFSCGWWAVDHDGVIYRILELYGCTGEADVGVRWTPERQFAEIRRIEDTHPWLKGREIQGVADPAIWDTSRGESIYETALRHRVFFTRGDNRRIPGWMQLHYRMSFDEQGYPMLYVFSGCRAFIRTIPELLFDQTDAEDVDTRQEDHVADESRYFCMSRPIPPQKRDTGLPLRADPLNMRTGG